MIIKEKDVLSDGSLAGQTSDKTKLFTRRNLMNTANNKSTQLNNSFISDTHDKICNCLGCNELADTEISLKIGEKSITISICSKCEYKFKES